jgi:nitroimidazol reductase NimA-like FMN-containing flavoprotein (pyridoxamine 5'-phosphate oxidase superfamily)
MSVQEMTEAECIRILSRTRLGRLACAHDNQPYVVPIYFAYERPYLYSFTMPGQKIEWMRSNPRVCVELDEIVDADEWLSILIYGQYQELAENTEAYLQEERSHAYRLLSKHAEWWKPGHSAMTRRAAEQPAMPIYYRVHIDRISGRRASLDLCFDGRRSSPS